VGIDQNMNGERCPSSTTPEQAFYNYLNPLAGRDNSQQNAADHYALIYLLESAVVEQAEGEHSGARTHTFDTTHLYYFGHSQGGITGPLFIPFEPQLRSVILSGAGGLLYWALLEKEKPVDIGGLLGTLIRDYPLDEFNNVLALVQMFIEPADPMNYARLITLEPPPGGTAKDVFQTEGLIDTYTPNSNIKALAVALGGQLVAPELDPIEGMAVAGRELAMPPLEGNVNGRTVGLLQYRQDTGSDGHFVIFDRASAQLSSLGFIETREHDGAAVIVP
jgi:hypothetical protein